MITELVTTGVFGPIKVIFRHISEVKVRTKKRIKNEFPAFTGKITHAHIVCTRPSLLLTGLGNEATVHHE